MSATLLSRSGPIDVSGETEDAPSFQEIKSYLLRLGAASFAHAHTRSLCQHLLHTRQILAHWSYPVWIQNAGALHSIYSTDVYKRQLVPLSERASVQSFAGRRTEKSVFFFCTLPRQSLFAALERRTIAGRGGDPLEVRSDSGTLLGTLNQEETDSLVAVHMANEAEQAQAGDGSPGLWLYKLHSLAKHLSGAVPRPAFLGVGRAVVSREQEQNARAKYLSGLEALTRGDRGEAAERLRESSALCDVWAEPTILRSYIVLQEGDFDATTQLTWRAKEQLWATGVAWDQRLAFRDWTWLACSLERLAGEGRRPFSTRVHRRFTLLTGKFDAAGAPAEARPAAPPVEAQTPAVAAPSHVAAEVPPTVSITSEPRFLQYMSGFANNFKNPKMFHYPSLSSRPFFEPETFPIVVDLEANFPQIREEILLLDDRAFHQENEKSIKRTGSWQVFMLYERGRKNQQNAGMCPTVTRIIERHTTVRTLAGLMYVSKMNPQTTIQAHRGPTNMRLRCHLGIQVPEGDCAIKVGGEVRRWQEGRCLVFDDYYEHEAWNRTDTLRKVLIIDIWHPNLSENERLLLEGLHRFAMAQTQSLNNYWNGNEKARRNNYD